MDAGQINIAEHRVYITGQDVNHIKNVLRMKTGEEIAVSNGEDNREYRCGIIALGEDMVTCELRFIKEDAVELPSRIYLFQGLPKSEKMELIIQKAVELGAYAIIPVAAKRCVVKLDEKKSKNKVLRWQQIAQSAAEQSRRAVIPLVGDVMGFDEAMKMASSMDVRIIPYELAEGMEKTKGIIESIKPGQDIAVFIGPEGGFDDGEIDRALKAGIEPVTLGRRILRTETAGFTVISWIMYKLEN